MLTTRTMRTAGLKLKRSAPSLSNEKATKLMSRRIQVYNRSYCYLRNRLSSPDLRSTVQAGKRKLKDHCYQGQVKIAECPILVEKMTRAFNNLATNTTAILDDNKIVTIMLCGKKLVQGINLPFRPFVHKTSVAASEQVLDLICHLCP